MSQTSDEMIGMNIAFARKERGLSQSELAERMTAKGWQFHQQTVLKLEKGQRPLRFAEAIDLAEVLGIGPGRLQQTPERLRIGINLQRALSDLDQLFVKIHDSALEIFGTAMPELRSAIDEAGEAGLDDVLAHKARHALGSHQPDGAVRLARNQHLASRAGDRTAQAILSEWRDGSQQDRSQVIVDQRDLGVPFVVGDRVVHKQSLRSGTRDTRYGTITNLVPPEKWPVKTRRGSGPVVRVVFDDDDKERRIFVQHLAKIGDHEHEEADDGVDQEAS